MFFARFLGEGGLFDPYGCNSNISALDSYKALKLQR